MRRPILVLILSILCVIAENTDDDDVITIEDEPIEPVTNDLEKAEFSKSFRKSRILWPYPYNAKNFSKENEENKNEESLNSNNKDDKKGRSSRFFRWTYPHSHMVDMVMQTMATHYAPAHSNDPFDFIRDSYPQSKDGSGTDEYDYIIVGGGTAGSVLAARLSEGKPKASVLLLEAGKPEMLITDIPALTQYLQLTDYVWPYTLEHQPGVCLGSEEQRCYLPRGKALGGNSVTNSMIYARSRPEDWNRIAADGNYGWSYNEILHYYLKTERAQLKKYKNATYHGRDGELTVENVPFKTGLIEAFLGAGRTLGYPTVDYNSPNELGFGYVQTISSDGHRLSTAKAFLHPHKRRKNLHIQTEARATKIIIEPQTKRAYAVEYIQNNIMRTARCRREVIISAGPIASPQLLMLSGVGPKENLETLGIPVIADVKVGRSLYDHIGFPGVVFKLNSTNASLMEPKVATLPNLMQWLQFGDGLLTSPGGVEGVGYMKTQLSENGDRVPDIELISMGGSLTSDSGGAIRRSWKISDRTYYNAFGSLSGVDTWQAIPILLHPKSKGYLELRDTSPFSHPKIFGNYLTDPKDIATLKEAVRFIMNIGESEQFKKYNAKIHLASYPSCASYAFLSDQYWDCAIRTMVVSFRRPISTCKMGVPNDPEAVVDPELRVYGVEGLRVVDSSIIPRTMSSDTSTQEILIAEKAADMIKKTWENIV